MVCYNLLIEAYGQSSHVKKAKSTYLALLDARCVPTEDTYAFLLKSYSNCGMLEKDEAFFSDMRKNGLPPIYSSVFCELVDEEHFLRSCGIVKGLQKASKKVFLVDELTKYEELYTNLKDDNYKLEDRIGKQEVCHNVSLTVVVFLDGVCGVVGGVGIDSISGFIGGLSCIGGGIGGFGIGIGGIGGGAGGLVGLVASIGALVVVLPILVVLVVLVVVLVMELVVLVSLVVVLVVVLVVLMVHLLQ
ncbi:hypothetical protein FXO38_33397 [Capsicum annuum]|nr:hypothetical protein FXO38_33397 [Capsicum annuum]KAF3627120.1 hypothetical protein FXO37_30029 [Capsicum annuum]